MEVLAGATAVLLSAIIVLLDVARPAGARPDAARPAGARPDAARPAGARPDAARPASVEPSGAPTAGQPPADFPPAHVPVSGPAAPGPVPSSAAAAAAAPVFSPAAGSRSVTVREGTRAPERAGERPPPAQTVLGVFRDTEPDRRTAGLRRTTSALLLAGVTIAVAGGVGGAIYLGLRSLG